MRRKPFLYSLIIFLMLITVACRTRAQYTALMETEQNKIVDSDSTILHKVEYASGSASGGCGYTSLVYWYGTEIVASDVIKRHRELFNEHDWQPADDTGFVWVKKEGEDTFRARIRIYEEVSDISDDPSAWQYQFPEDFTEIAESYPTIYATTLYIVPPCFEEIKR